MILKKPFKYMKNLSVIEPKDFADVASIQASKWRII